MRQNKTKKNEERETKKMKMKKQHRTKYEDPRNRKSTQMTNKGFYQFTEEVPRKGTLKQLT